jgi:hypothetical protein
MPPSRGPADVVRDACVGVVGRPDHRRAVVFAVARARAHWCASAGRKARVCGALRSSRRRGSTSSGGRRMRCKLRVRDHGRVAVACDATDGAAHEACGVQLVWAERRPAVAVPQPRLLPDSAFGLDVRVEHDKNGSPYPARSSATGGVGALPLVRAISCGTTAITPLVRSMVRGPLARASCRSDRRAKAWPNRCRLP